MSGGAALRGFFGLVWRMLEGLRRVLNLLLLLIVFGFVLAALHTSIPTVPRSAALVVAPEGELVEELSSDPLRRAFGEASGGPAPETLLKDVVDAITLAKSDSRIKLIVLEVGNLSPSGLSKLQEIAALKADIDKASPTSRPVALRTSIQRRSLTEGESCWRAAHTPVSRSAIGRHASSDSDLGAPLD